MGLEMTTASLLPPDDLVTAVAAVTLARMVRRCSLVVMVFQEYLSVSFLLLFQSLAICGSSHK